MTQLDDKKYLEINVYSYPDRMFLGQRVLQKRWLTTTTFGNTSDEINEQVNEVRKLRGKTEKTSYFTSKAY